MPYCLSDQVATSCMGLIIKGPWFNLGAFFGLLNKGIKIWCSSTSSTGTRLFERCCHSPEGFIDLMQRGPREGEARFLRFNIQRPVNLIYLPHLLAHAILTVDACSPTILSGRDAATTSNQQVILILQTLNEYNFGVRRGQWCEIFRKNGLSALREWVFSPSTGPQESKDMLQKH